MTENNSKFNIIYYESVDSTNNIAKTLAKDGAKEGTVVVAKRQTAGRGRLGRQFYSEEGGLYLSIILRPQILAENAVQITAAAAVAVARACEEISDKKALIKWVNDIYMDNKKVSGILCEGVINPENKALSYAILGIGINVEKKSDFPPEIRDIATTLFEDTVDEDIYKNLTEAILKNFFKEYRALTHKTYLKEYRKRSILIGKEVTFEQNGDVHTAEVIGIDDAARLILSENGNTVKLGAGEVSVKLK